MYSETTQFVISQALEIAKLHLLDKGEFLPFALIELADESIEHLYTPEPLPEDTAGSVYQKIEARLEKKTINEDCRTIVIVSNMRSVKDAKPVQFIRVELESYAEPAQTFGLPYELSEDDITFDEPAAEPRLAKFITE
jgi:hypothetical protein